MSIRRNDYVQKNGRFIRCCPFCNSLDVDVVDSPIAQWGSDGYAVRCESCESSGPYSVIGETAVHLWNNGLPRVEPIFTNAVLCEIDGV